MGSTTLTAKASTREMPSVSAASRKSSLGFGGSFRFASVEGKPPHVLEAE
jgi:hypothetical protein